MVSVLLLLCSVFAPVLVKKTENGKPKPKTKKRKTWKNWWDLDSGSSKDQKDDVVNNTDTTDKVLTQNGRDEYYSLKKL